MSIESVMPANYLILYCHLLLLPSIFPRVRVFPSESVLHIRWPKYWSFFQWIFRTDFLKDWLVGSPCSPRDSQESFPMLLQKHWFFGAQLSLSSNSHILTTEKATAWTRWTFVGKVMSLLFNMLSRLVTAFLPRHKLFLISWLDFGAQEYKVCLFSESGWIHVTTYVHNQSLIE